MRRAARTDRNHKDVVAALKACGWTVVDCSRLGDGFPDLLAARAGVLRLVEIKDGSRSPSRRRLTPQEETVHTCLKAAGVTVRILTTVDEALAL
jgi:Holliday junction resolvase